MEQANETLKELYTGIFGYMVIVGLIGTLVISDKKTFVFGFVLGILLSAMLIYHMFQCINKSLDMMPKQASAYTKSRSILRAIIMGLAVALSVLLPDIFHVLGMVLGLMAIKASAYLQPFIHKYIYKRI